MFIGNTDLTIPYTNIITIRLKKESDRPLSAPVIPMRKQDMPRIRFTRTLSPIIPARILTNTPDRLAIPQILPIWTRFKLRSSDISLKRAGIHEKGKAATNVLVAADKPNISHLYLG